MDWSGMIPDVLAIIAQQHIVVFEDYHSFACVCKSWHSAAIEAAKKHKFPNGPPSRFPYLMLPQKSKDKEFRELLMFFPSKNIRRGSIRKIRLPQIYDKAFMTSCGWLVNVGEDRASQLIHPLSLETINLPKVDSIIPWWIYKPWHTCIQKLLLLVNKNQSSSELPLVVVLSKNPCKIGFCQPGDSKWTHFHQRDLYDFTYYNGKVYCFDCENYILEWDVHGKDPTGLALVSNMPGNLYDGEKVGIAYLIGLDDGERKRLLVIIREYNVLKKHSWTKRFIVLAYDLTSKKWSKVKDLGTKALFVGNTSFWIEEDTRELIKGNCIYFIDDGYISKGSWADGKAKDMGIYHLSDETIEPYYNGPLLSHLTPPGWLQSI